MPEATQVHIDAALTNVSVAYKNTAFIADELAPVVGVRKQFDRYFIHDAEREVFRSTDDKRAPGAEANEIDFALSTDSYAAEDHALTSVIPDEERDNADPPFQPNIDRTEFLTDKILLNKEIQLASIVTDPTFELSRYSMPSMAPRSPKIEASGRPKRPSTLAIEPSCEITNNCGTSVGETPRSKSDSSASSPSKPLIKAIPVASTRDPLGSIASSGVSATPSTIVSPRSSTTFGGSKTRSSSS